MTSTHLAGLKVVIVDDEPLARRNLKSLLSADPEITVSECASGMEAIAHIRASKPDLLFIDIQMPECDGFDVLEMLGADLPPAIVFVTAYDQYALRAFEAGALDYLLKPFDDARFERTLARAKIQVEAARAIPRASERIAIKQSRGVLLLKISEIDWVEAADYYVCLHAGARTHLLRRSMAELEEELNPTMFCRIHRSSIVNLRSIKSLAFNEQGEYEVVLENGTRLRLSRGYRREFQKRLGLRS